MAEKYKPRADPNQTPDVMTPTGLTSRVLVGREESSQRAVAENPEWLIARRLNHVRGDYRRGEDSRPELEALGFRILGESDDLFYKVSPPEGWDKSTEGLWTTVADKEGHERMSQFYKGAFYDRDAFLNINSEK